LNKLTIRYNNVSETIELYFRNDDLSNYLSSVLSQSERTWDKKQKCWVILPGVLGKVIVYARHLFNNIDASSLPINLQKRVQKALQGNYEDDYSSEENTNLSLKKDNSPYSILYLTTDAPEFVVKAVYKTLAFKYHPDRGGEAEQFQKVKEAYESITKASS
jgi:hypothetical protein